MYDPQIMLKEATKHYTMFLCCTNVSLLIFKNCVFLLCSFMCLPLCVQTGVCICLQRPEDVVYSPGTRATGYCELLEISLGTEISPEKGTSTPL